MFTFFGSITASVTTVFPSTCKFPTLHQAGISFWSFLSGVRKTLIMSFDYRFIITDLTSVYCWSPYSPSSRPIPDCLNPPNGDLGSSTL